MWVRNILWERKKSTLDLEGFEPLASELIGKHFVNWASYHKSSMCSPMLLFSGCVQYTQYRSTKLVGIPSLKMKEKKTLRLGLEPATLRTIGGYLTDWATC